jgi:hypothetical protein
VDVRRPGGKDGVVQGPFVAFEAPSRAMHALWVRGPSEPVAAAVLAMPVPGDPALRGRFHLLCDEPERGVDVALFAISFEAFRAEVDGIDAGHDALTRHDAAAAEAAFEGVLDHADRSLHPLPIVDALIGLGELARHRSNDEEAMHYYEQALELAGKVRYRYGRLQALLPLGHLTIRNGAAEEALKRFRAAESLARELDDRLALANALLGEAEAFERRRDWADASTAISDAASIFTALNSQVGVGACLQRWGDLLRRRGWRALEVQGGNLGQPRCWRSDWGGELLRRHRGDSSQPRRGRRGGSRVRGGVEFGTGV